MRDLRQGRQEVRDRGYRLRRRLSAKRLVAAAAVAAGFVAFLAPIATAAPPTILSTEVSAVTTTSATLKAKINPGGAKTFYHFEYDIAACPTVTCVKVPKPDGAIEAGSSPILVTAEAVGLSPGTTYHLRLVAKNPAEVTAERLFATYSAPPPPGPCSNDTLRALFNNVSAALPDCRAYEQASPVNKNGSDATGSVSFAKASPDGNGVSFLSTTGVPGGEGSQTIPMYLAQRGTNAWSTQGVLPKAKSGQNVHILGWLPDFASVFHQALKFATPGVDALLARSSNGGALTEVAPYAPQANYDYAGASADGSVVAFESTSKLAGVSAALEGKPNVYVFSGGKLALADIMNEGEVPAEGAFTAPYNWAKGTNKTTLHEGGAEREYYTQDSHAVTSAGAIFFTAAGTGQLYERINPTQAQSPLNGEGKCNDPALACTLHVSATQKTNGKGKEPDGSDAAGRRPAAFQAASADGSVAYFTSSEKLTNDANTGPEPELPSIARSSLDGSGKELTFLPADAQGIATDSEYVYWANPKAGTIGRAKLNGEDKEDPFITPGPVEGVPSEPQWVAVDGTHIYWTNTGEQVTNEGGELEPVDEKGTIGRAKLNGEEVEPAIVKGASNPLGIAVDSEHIYWANSGSIGKFRGIGRAKLDGSEAIQPWSVDTFGDPLGFPTNGGVALDATYVYFSGPTTKDGGNIERIEKAEPKNFDSIYFVEKAGARFQGLAVQGPNIYWANTGNSTIGRAKLNPTPAVSEVNEELITEAGRPAGLAANATNLLWSANQESEPNSGNDLYRYEPATDTLSDITAKPSGNGAEVQGVLGAAKDGSALYFAANGVLAVNAGALGTHASQGNCHGAIGSMGGTCNLYHWQKGSGGSGAIEFVARLEVNGGERSTDALDWAPTPTGLFFTGSEAPRTADVSADGDTLLFRSQQQLTSYDNQGTSELYRHEAGKPEVECVSCNPTGEGPVGAPGLGQIIPTESKPIRPAAVASQNLSADGKRVFFETPDALVGADTNGLSGCPPTGSAAQQYPACLDVYEWEAKDSGTCQGESEDGGCLYFDLDRQGKGTLAPCRCIRKWQRRLLLHSLAAGRPRRRRSGRRL